MCSSTQSSAYEHSNTIQWLTFSPSECWMHSNIYMGATHTTKMEATHNDQPNNEILCKASTCIKATDAVPTVRRRSDTDRTRASVLPLHTRRIMGGDGVKCRKPLKHRPAMEGVLHCKQCEVEALHESMPDKNWDDGGERHE